MDLTSLAQMTGIAGGLGLFFWKIIDKRFDQIDKKFENLDEKFKEVKEEFKAVRSEIKEVRDTTFEIKERLSALESETILYNLIPDENKRSEAAKRMWEKRKTKKLIKHTPDK